MAGSPALKVAARMLEYRIDVGNPDWRNQKAERWVLDIGGTLEDLDLLYVEAQAHKPACVAGLLCKWMADVHDCKDRLAELKTCHRKSQDIVDGMRTTYADHQASSIGHDGAAYSSKDDYNDSRMTDLVWYGAVYDRFSLQRVIENVQGELGVTIGPDKVCEIIRQKADANDIDPEPTIARLSGKPHKRKTG